MKQEKNRFRVGKVFITITNPQDTVDRIKTAIQKKEGGYICVSNMRMVRYAGENIDYCDLMSRSLMNLPDGTPLTWIGKLWGLKDVACTNGPALFKTMLKEGNNGCKHYLLGDTEDVIAEILKINKLNYHANIVGAEALPFCNAEDFDYEGIARRIKETGANIVWTAMRAPKQDQFDKILCEHLDGVVAIGVGRAFRLLIGSVRSAPKWAQKIGFAGIFTRKVSLLKVLIWYFETFFFLVGYSVQIVLLKMIGRKCYD